MILLSHMTGEIPTATPEKKEALDDNALKFIIGDIDLSSVTDNDVTAYLMTTDWIDIGADDEEKLVIKHYTDGTIDWLRIKKVIDESGGRKSKKVPISEMEYIAALVDSKITVVKTRTDFTYTQNDIVFKLTYDEFDGSPLRIMEVDAKDEQQRISFKPTMFPAGLESVTGDIRYYGYRVADML